MTVELLHRQAVLPGGHSISSYTPLPPPPLLFNYSNKSLTLQRAPPADGLGRRPRPRWVAVREGGVAEQRAQRRAAEGAEGLQLRPPALDQVLLRVLGVRQRRVEEDQQVVTQRAVAHITAVGAAVPGHALVESGTQRRAKIYQSLILC